MLPGYPAEVAATSPPYPTAWVGNHPGLPGPEFPPPEPEFPPG